MPRRALDRKKEKVISAKISAQAYELLQGYARDHYIEKKITLPTISELVRNIINEWLAARPAKPNGYSEHESKLESTDSQPRDPANPNALQELIDRLNKPFFEQAP